MIDAALGYARRGWKIFPCGVNKQPLTRNGFKDATDDPEQIKEWWSKNPSASIGFAVPDGLLVLDIDQPDGPESLQDLREAHKPLPATRTQRTGGGGLQYFFKTPAGLGLRNTAGKLGKGLDTRAAGGYVILPPSGHPSGGHYQWLDEGEISEAPQWLIELLTPKKQEQPQATRQASANHPYVNAAVRKELDNVASSPKGQRNDTLNRAAFALGQFVGGRCLDQAEAESLLLDAALAVGLEYPKARATISSGLSAGMAEPRGVPQNDRTDTGDDGGIVKGDHLATAAKFLKDYPEPLITYQGETLSYGKGMYSPILPADLAAALLTWSGRQIDADTKAQFRPNRNWRANAEEALQALTNVTADHAPPCWLDGRDYPPAAEIISCTNGLLNVHGRELMPPNSEFFTLNALPFAYDPEARATRWSDFLEDVFGGDEDAIQCLQETFGYLLTTSTKQQKIFLIVGPKRSGKGTLARVLSGLLGQKNVAGPTLNSLSQPFGLASLVGKTLAIISDARLSGRADQSAVVERLLSISGEDFLSIPRKYLTDIALQLPTRFLILSNELPRLGDASGALSSRFIVFSLPTSFYGREDPGLTGKLLAELPGILNWALDGLEILTDRGYFLQPECGKAALQELEDLTSPMGVFVRECCEVRPDHYIECRSLFEQWRRWCDEEHRTMPGTVASFGRDLRAAVPGVQTRHRRQGDNRFRVFEGINTV